MAIRRCLHALSRRAGALLASSPSIQPLKIVATQYSSSSVDALLNSRRCILPNLESCHHWSQNRLFSSDRRDDDDSEDEDEDEDEDGEVEEESESDIDCKGYSKTISKKEYTAEEKEAEAAEIGYKVIGPLQRSDRVFKDYEPVFAVVQIGSHQFKVSNGDCIFTERLKFCDVHDKVILNKILMLGSKTQTIIGRPILPDAEVHAIVEEHALDAKVIIFKKKRRKNYRRTNGHRQELTKLRITNIEGIEKPEIIVTEKPLKAPCGRKTDKVKSEKAKSENVAVPA